MPPYPCTSAAISASMKSVLHVGPVNTDGGMATVIRILNDNPPDGWRSSTLSTHRNGCLLEKYLKWRAAFKQFKNILSNPHTCPDLIHIHCASDWSWWRKSRIVKYAVNKCSIPCVMHIHSGKFDAWLNEKPRRIKSTYDVLCSPLITTVVLSEYWKNIFNDKIGKVIVADNPIDPEIMSIKSGTQYNKDANDGEMMNEGEVDKTILMMGRNDPVKGHEFAVDLFHKVRREVANLQLNITGFTGEGGDNVNSLGWVSEEEKKGLLDNADVLLVPSKYEGQPMVIIEALSCGLPVICSDQIPPTPNSVIRAKGNDIADWSEKLIEVLKSPPSNEDIAEDCQPHWIDSVRKNWLRIYSTALSK